MCGLFHTKTTRTFAPRLSLNNRASSHFAGRSKAVLGMEAFGEWLLGKRMKLSPPPPPMGTPPPPPFTLEDHHPVCRDVITGKLQTQELTNNRLTNKVRRCTATSV